MTLKTRTTALAVVFAACGTFWTAPQLAADQPQQSRRTSAITAQFAPRTPAIAPVPDAIVGPATSGYGIPPAPGMGPMGPAFGSPMAPGYPVVPGDPNNPSAYPGVAPYQQPIAPQPSPSGMVPMMPGMASPYVGPNAAASPTPYGATPTEPSSRLLRFGWPAIAVTRRDLPYPEEEERGPKALQKVYHPRRARLEIIAPSMARIFVDGKELECNNGFYRFEHEKELIPGNQYMHDVRVEGYDGAGNVSARTVSVYLRLGRVTELTFH